MSRTAPERTIIVAITGGSGAGKTTVAEALTAALAPLSVALLREDDYYNDNAATPDFDAASFNFDHVDSRDHALLADHLAALKSGRAIDMPHYDFVLHGRRPDGTRLEPAEIVILEGTHILHSHALRALYDFAIYLDVPDDIRFLRRLRRDVAERGRSLDSVTRQYLRTVRPMHYCFTHPTRIHADHVIAFDDETLAASSAVQMKKLEETIAAVARTILMRLSD